MTMRDLFVRLGGHDPIALRGEGREATQPIAMAGSTVLMAAVVTSANWAIAAHALAGGGGRVGAAIAAAIGGALGFLLVVTLDRAGIYQMDTHSGRWSLKAAVLAVRLVIVVLVSGVTAGAVAPEFLAPELEAHALQMREQSELGHMHMLDARFSIGPLKQASGQAGKDVAAARAAIGLLPPEVLRQQIKVKSCWQGYAARKVQLTARAEAGMLRNAQTALQRRGFYRDDAVDGIWGPRTAGAVLHFQRAERLPSTGRLDPRTLAGLGIHWTSHQAEDEAREALKDVAAGCNGEAAAAGRAQDAYDTDAQNALHRAEANRAAASSAFDRAQQAVSARLAQAGKIEEDAITPQSATVLASLLASDPGARSKWYGILGLITSLELLPLLLKMLGGRTVPGVRIATDRDVAIAMHEGRRATACDDHRREAILRAAMDVAMNQALASSELREITVRLFQSKVEALVPIEIAKRLLVEIQSGAREAEAAMRHHPDCAEAIGEAWARAMDEVSERLRTGRAHVQA